MTEEPKLPKNLPLRNEIREQGNRRAAPKPWLAWLDESARIGGDDDGNLQRNAKSLAQAKQFTIDIDAAIDLAAHITQRGPLYDLATIAFGEMVRDILLDSPAGRAGLKAVIERVANEARALQAAEAARQAQESEAERRRIEARLADEIAAMDPATELNKIAAAGVVLSIDPAGVITAVPSGRLSMPWRRMIDSKRDVVAALLKNQQVGETL